MPGFDGTGPMGMGPMTGGGRGFCSPSGIGAGLRRYGITAVFEPLSREVKKPAARHHCRPKSS